MRKVLLLVSIWATCVCAYAQSYTADHLLEKKSFDKAWTKLQKAILKNPEDISALYGVYVYYSDRDNSAYDIEQAYHSLYLAYTAYANLDEKSIAKLQKDEISSGLIKFKAEALCEILLQQVLEENSLPGVQYFIEHYSLKNDQQQQTAILRQHLLSFNIAEQENTTEAYLRFIQSFPNAAQVEKAWGHIYDLEWDVATTKNTAADYLQYVKDYPKSPHRQQAQQRIYQLEWQSACQADNKAAYQRYIDAYKDSPYIQEAKTKISWYDYYEQTADHTYDQYVRYLQQHPQEAPADSAQKEVYHILLEKGDWRTMKSLIDQQHLLTAQWRDSVLWQIHKAYMDADINNMYPFYNMYSDAYVSTLKKQDDVIREQWNWLDLDDWSNCAAFIKTAAPYYIAYYVLQRMIAHDLSQKDYVSALGTVEMFNEQFGQDKNYQSLYKTLSAANEGIVKKKLPSTVNNSEYSQYAPVISADGKQLYFCRRTYSEDIYVSHLVKGQWTAAKPMNELNDYQGNEATEAISVDGTTMILFTSGMLSESHREYGRWSEPERLSDNINMCDWQADVHITADGKAMLFAAKKETVADEISTMDYYNDANFQSINIFVCLRDEDGNWGPAIDLGPTINTAHCDRSPFLHPDGKTLYFSSYGHGSMGGMDVFMSKRLSEDSWTEWSEPINMGKEINTGGSDWGYKITTDGATGYFSAKSEGNESIYTCNIPKHLRPNMVAVVSGKLTDKKGEPISTEIRWEDLSTSTEVGISHTNPDDGSYYMVLPLGKEYGYYVDHEDFFPISNSIDLTNVEKAQTIEQDLQTVSYTQMIEEELPVPMNNLFFETGKFGLKITSYAELKRVAKIIQQHQLKVEISGHTDNVGDAATNLTLSEQRANAVRDFLVEQGCAPLLLTAVGKGSTQPIAANDTEANRRKNRRVELKFIH